ncbi:hypothetical protein [Bacillus sp. 2205SS5-2]|uniref:hypothetical protein n=1 Tax=Bacillus sp. 2205SS5-2 TaxID=3109031 RepID=UPI00300537E7
MTETVSLTEEQLVVCRQYIDLLDTMEEGFQYILSAYENQREKEANLMLLDLFSALTQISKSNQLLVHYFQNDEEIVSEIESFSEVEDFVRQVLAGGNKQKIIESSLFPAFFTWKLSVEEHLIHYVKH